MGVPQEITQMLSMLSSRKWLNALLVVVGGSRVCQAQPVGDDGVLRDEACDVDVEPGDPEDTGPPPFDSVVTPLWDELVHFATRLARGDRATGEDIVQDSLIRAMAAWSTFRPLVAPNGHVDVRASARAWMYRIVSNTFYSAYGARRRRDAVLDRVAAEIRAEEQRASAVRELPGEDNIEATEDIVLALEQLPDQWRKILLMIDVEGMEQRHVAKALGITRGTVASSITRARVRVAEALTGYKGSLSYEESVRSVRRKLATWDGELVRPTRRVKPAVAAPVVAGSESTAA